MVGTCDFAAHQPVDVLLETRNLPDQALESDKEDRAPVRMEGKTSEVLRKPAIGEWLFAIDDPWGAAILS